MRTNQVTNVFQREHSKSSSFIVNMAIDFDWLNLAVLNIEGLIVFQLLLVTVISKSGGCSTSRRPTF